MAVCNVMVRAVLPRIAFVDESETPYADGPGAYLLAAALVPNDVQAEARARMSGLRRSGRTKAHWHDARTRSEKRTLVDAVVEIPIRTLVVVRVDDPEMRTERRRRLCLERLLFELQQRGIAEIVAESRGPGDRHDLDHLQALRSQKRVTTELRLRHLPGPVEPLLWIPDVVCGAVRQARLGDDQYLRQLAPSVDIVQC